MKKVLPIVIPMLLTLLCGPESAHALSITPGRTEVHLLPGQKVDMEYLVKNDHAEKLNIDVTQKNWFLYEKDKDITVDQWLKIRGKTHFSLKPGQERKVPVTISCPPKAEGVLVGMTSFTFHKAEPSMLTPRISVSIYLSVDGTIHAAGELGHLGARVWKGVLTAGAEVKATGNVHLRPSGTIEILDAQGAPAAEYRVIEGDPVYPGQKRSYVGVRQGENTLPPPGKYVMKAHLTSGGVVLDGQKSFELFKDGKVQMEGEDKPS